MKSVILTVGLLVAATSGFSQAARGHEGAPTNAGHGISSSISQSDAAQILLTCFNQPKFEKYYASNGAGAINILEKSGIQLSPKAMVFGRSLSFHKKEASKTGTLSNFFSIGEVKNENGQVTVSLTYFYNHTKAGYKTVMVDVALAKKGDKYQIVNSNFQGDLL